MELPITDRISRHQNQFTRDHRPFLQDIRQSIASVVGFWTSDISVISQIRGCKGVTSDFRGKESSYSNQNARSQRYNHNSFGKRRLKNGRWQRLSHWRRRIAQLKDTASAIVALSTCVDRDELDITRITSEVAVHINSMSIGNLLKLSLLKLEPLIILQLLSLCHEFRSKHVDGLWHGDRQLLFYDVPIRHIVRVSCKIREEQLTRTVPQYQFSSNDRFQKFLQKGFSNRFQSWQMIFNVFNFFSGVGTQEKISFSWSLSLSSVWSIVISLMKTKSFICSDIPSFFLSGKLKNQLSNVRNDNHLDSRR
jgi:hypothetical protein